MNEKLLQVLRSSEDPKMLLSAALALCRSGQPGDHAALLSHLCSADFLGRLDTAADYRAAASVRLRVARVVDALGGNKTPSAHSTIVALARDRTFLSEDQRVVALIKASVAVRPAPDELVSFWDRYCQPDDGFTPLTVTTLVENGTDAALALLEKKMADPGHEDEVKIAWMRSRILRHRNDTGLLNSCERMLRGGLSEKLRPPLVEVLFDYRPGEWYRPASVSSPPDRADLSAEGRAQLRRIGEYVLADEKLTEQQRSAVETTLIQLEGKPSRSDGGT